MRRLRRLTRERNRLREEGRFLDALPIARQITAASPSGDGFLKLGVILRELGSYHEALAAFRQALRFKDGSADLAREIQLHKAYAWLRLGRKVEMRKSIERALLLRANTGSNTNLRIMLGSDHFHENDFRRALAEFALAEETAATPFARGNAIGNQAASLLRAGEWEKGLARLDVADRIHRAHRHVGYLAVNRMRRAAVYFDFGQRTRSLTLLERAARTGRDLASAKIEAEALLGAAYVRIEMGHLDGVRENLDRALHLAQSLEEPMILVRAHACRAVARGEEGDYDGASEDLRRTRNLLRGEEYPIGTLFLSRARGRVAALLGDWAEMRAAAITGERTASALMDVPRAVEFREMLALAEANLGRTGATRAATAGARRLKSILPRPARAMERIMHDALRLARTGLRILIVGDCRSEMMELARRIHGASRRAKGPYVAVPCDTLANPWIEICGHVRGAFTGACTEKQGFLRDARGGTLVLERIDAMPAEEQQSLGRILDGKARPVGGGPEEAMDVRFIAICTDDAQLPPAILRRFAHATLRLPTLSERVMEIPRLVRAYLGGRRITLDALAALARREWRGGYAELRATVERLRCHVRGTIGIRHVQRHLSDPISCLPAHPDTVCRHP
ncbi:MAG: sigma 54-interacting transcriptional regulator [Planctomycetes bacterium]|nr:sigma 54-interacting transcriptional regulator [Planctomycetota bacterium]